MQKRGVLLVNIGSPLSPAKTDVRRFLSEFLMDGRVIDLPFLLRFCLVHCLIVPIRAARAAAAYGTIWTAHGSPLVVNCTQLKTALQQQLGVTTELAMRYGAPSIASALTNLAAKGVTHLMVVPLFPHYAMSTYETAVDRVRTLAKRHTPLLHLIVHPPFYSHPEYINALVKVAREHLPGDFDHLLFSFHSLPVKHLRKTDPTRAHCLTKPDCCQAPSPAHATCYKHQCLKTVEAFVESYGLEAQKYSVAFQSRFGPGQWLQPSTVEQLRRLAKAGVKKIAVICPSFVADCIETLEEIGVRARAEFLSAGGREFVVIPCLNAQPVWVEALANMINQMFDQHPAA